mgnify:CR=1 FL=1
MALTAKKVYAILKRQISDMEAKIKTPIIYRGTVATADLLPLNPDIGDMYNIESKSVYGEAGMNVAWNGVVWDTMGAPIDMSLYIKSSELADWVKQQNKPTYTAEEVGALPADTKIPSKTSDLQNDSGFLTKIPDNYLSGTDKTLSVSGKAADAKATGDKITELSTDISNKLNKNQGSENSGKIAGINESGDIVPMFPVSVDYNEETNCLEFGSDQKMELNKGINLDSTLTKTGYAADAGTVGEITNSLKEDLSNKITKFYASNQGETHITDSDNGKIMDMMLYGKSEQKQYSGKNLLNATFQTTTQNGVTCTNNGDGTYALNGSNANIPSVFTLGTVYLIKDKKYKMAGCPANPGKAYLQLRTPEPDNVAYKNDYSSGVEFVIPKSGEYIVRIYYDVETYNNLLFKPMITTDLTATYDDFEPYTGGIPSPNPDYPQEIKSVVNPTVKVSNEDGTQFKTVTLPYTLNAIPVNSGGNITIDGQQYIADYVDVERGKLVRMVGEVDLGILDWAIRGTSRFSSTSDIKIKKPTSSAKKVNELCTIYRVDTFDNIYGNINDKTIGCAYDSGYVQIYDTAHNDGVSLKQALTGIKLYFELETPEEIDLTEEEIAALKALETYYPITNISINSEQLDGYTVFNYPISMANGWNYVKKQLNDNRDYIYDMDIQSAEAYVNSEYAVALTELEV